MPLCCVRCGNVLERGTALCANCGTPVPGVTPARAMRRPGLVSFLSILHFLAAVGFVAAAFAIALSAQRTVIGMAVAALFLVVAGLHGACSWGLWNLTPWGRVLQIVFSWMGLILFPIVGTIISILLLVYFSKPGTKILFSGRSPNQLSLDEVAVVYEVTGGGRRLVVAIIAITLIGIMVTGVIAAIAVPNLLTAIQRAKQKRTLSDMQTIGALIERYKVEKGYYPEVRTMEELAGVDPEAAKLRNDAWDHEYRISSALEGWFLASAGKDGTFEHEDLRAYPKGTTRSFDSDIVFSDGGPIQVPEGIQR
jgi:type II secretory pathway pseudopilin PulG